MAYKVQNYAFDLALLVNNEALLISVNLNRATSYVYVLGQVSREELLKLLPET